MKIDAKDIKTDEVKNWKGLHLLFYPLSSCSQKVRILLDEKSLNYNPVEIDLAKGTQSTPWFLGINPRGVVPVLIHDGDIHIESNDILEYLDQTFTSSQGSYLPETEVEINLTNQLMDLEEKLHNDLRIITFSYLIPAKAMKKSEKHLQEYANNGEENSYRSQQVEWWKELNKDGIKEQQVLNSIAEFHSAFTRLENTLNSTKFLIGNRITLADITWFITIHRLSLAGYPLKNHPNLLKYYQSLCHRSSFKKQITAGSTFKRFAGLIYRKVKSLSGNSLHNNYQKAVYRNTHTANNN